MDIALMGFGNIGSGIYYVLKKHGDFNVKKILVQSLKNRDNTIFTENIDDIINDENIKIVVDAIGDSSASYEYSLKIIKSGKNLVTGNSDLVSKHLKELIELSNQYNVKFCFESSVGAGIPWINVLYEYKKVNKINEVFGSMNGTTNFILDLMKKDGVDFEQALLKSRILRYQEPNYFEDINGIDSRNKLAISASLAFNVNINPEDIPTYGINNIRNLDFGFFERHKLTPKLMSYACIENNRIASVVAPVLYKNERLRSNVGGNNNLLGFVGDVVGKVEIIGEGAGKFSAANGIILDLYRVKNECESPKFSMEDAITDETIVSYKFYFSFDQSSYKIERILLPYVQSIYETSNSFVLTTRTIPLDTCLELLWKIEQTEERFFFAIYDDLDII